MKKVLLVVLIMIFMLALVSTASAGWGDKQDLCHVTGNGNLVKISVSDNAVDTHLSHGDLSPLHIPGGGTTCDGY